MNQIKAAHALNACKSLIEEHRQTEKLLDDLDNWIKSIKLNEPVSSEIRKKLDEVIQILVQEMNVHFACEEQGLFPVLSKYHSMVLMEVEHEEILDLLNQVEMALKADNINVIKDIGPGFTEYLRDHIVREDEGIFPMAERELSLTEKQIVIQKMSVIRENSLKNIVPNIERPLKTYSRVVFDLDKPLEQPVAIKTLLEHGQTTIKQIILAEGESLASHWSPKEGFLYCISGEAELKFEDRIEQVLPGDGFLIDPLLLHALAAKKESRFLLVSRQV